MLSGIGCLLGPRTSYNKHLYRATEKSHLIMILASITAISLVLFAINLGSSSSPTLAFCSGDPIRYASLGIFASSLIDSVVLGKRSHNLRLAKVPLTEYRNSLKAAGFSEGMSSDEAYTFYSANKQLLIEQRSKLIQAANLGNSYAMYAIAYNYVSRLYGSRDENEILKWLNRSAALGHDSAKQALKTKAYLDS